jgi:hypothetical protein
MLFTHKTKEREGLKDPRNTCSSKKKKERERKRERERSEGPTRHMLFKRQ